MTFMEGGSLIQCYTSVDAKWTSHDANLERDPCFLLYYVVLKLEEQGCPNSELKYKLYEWLIKAAVDQCKNTAVADLVNDTTIHCEHVLQNANATNLF
jgi:hypothetical protein